ncbi:MAG: cysteine--tRNA ligase, partial [Micromonosporaceae bacterium]|nr:cysteine--tRNA ligase [Micromonosporaceae bacterium]
SSVNYDVLRRWLMHSGYAVTFIRNITDIDDKIIAKSIAEQRPFWAIAYANELVLAADYAALGVLPPTYEPRATGHVPEMHELIKRLIDKGHAYVAADGSGDVYFDVRSFPEYGSLSGRRPSDMEPAADGPARAKRDPLDFALWKGTKPGDPAETAWPSPWGHGRPGWHIECSAMSWKYLGDEFDIHGGGHDIAFPHHENELAQSRGAGLGFARHWVHHALLNLGPTKMSKSLGNVITLTSLIEAGLRPAEVRYYLGTPHYRSTIDYSDEALREAAAAYRRIEGFVQRAEELVAARAAGPGRVPEPGEAGERGEASELGEADASGGLLPEAFVDAMNDDLNTSRAMAIVHDAVRHGNTLLASGETRTLVPVLREVRAMLGVFGLDPLDAQWASAISTAGSDSRNAIDALVSLALGQRDAARVRKDWSAADAIRDQLREAGVLVEDTPNGPRWTLSSEGGA